MCGNRYILLRWRVNQPTERHFNSRGHKFSDIRATILEKGNLCGSENSIADTKG